MKLRYPFLLLIILVFSGNVCPQAGVLDPGFGTNGIVETDLPELWAAQAIAIQNDGKIVTAGFSNIDFGLARYNSDGSIDESFGSDGFLTTDINLQQDASYSITIQNDGKILAAGISSLTANQQESDFALIRYHANGTPDSTFGNYGITTLDLSDADGARSMAIQTDNKILVCGRSQQSLANQIDFTILPYTNDGLLDTAFGNGGIVITDFENSDNYFNSMVLQNDGKILVAGYSYNQLSGLHSAMLLRYNENGSIDTTFGEAGFAITNFEGNSDANSVIVQNDGKILLGGGAGGDLFIARYDNAGNSDISFGNSGIVLTDIENHNDWVAKLLLQPDGKIVAVGATLLTSSNSDLFISRYHTDGSPDNLFGLNGIVISELNDLNADYDAVFQNDGKLVVTASFWSTTLARYDMGDISAVNGILDNNIRAYPNPFEN